MAKIEKNGFRGGYRFRRFAGQPEAQLHSLPIPGFVRLSRGNNVPPLVTKGDTVRAGQIVARSDETVSSPAVATVSGTVEVVGDGQIVIKADGSSDWEPIEGHSAEWDNLEAGRLEEILYFGGLTALAPDGIPTRRISAPVGTDDIEHIIVHHICDEPFGADAGLLLSEYAEGALDQGLQILGRIMPGASLHVAVDKAARSVLDGVQTEGVRLHAASDKYPQSQQEVLIPSILGKAFPNGYAAINMGVLLVDLQSVLQIRDAVILGKPAIERIVALSGTGFRTNGHVLMRTGSPLSVLKDHLTEIPAKIIADSLLTGKAVTEEDVVPPGCGQIVAIPDEARELLGWAQPGFKKDSISRTFAANFLPLRTAADTGLHGEHRPCIVCNFCDDVCPAGILPHLLHRAVSRNQIDENLVRYKISDCIDCNLCTYVCPSKIPVAALMAEGKHKALEEGLVSMERIRHRFALKGLAADQPEAEL